MKRVMNCTALYSVLLALAATFLWMFFRWNALLFIAITAGTVFYHIGVRLLIGCTFDRLLNNQVDFRNKWFQPFSLEKSLYESFHVKQWKKKLPTYNASLFDPSLHSWADIAKAMCQAELIHEANIIVSFVPILFSVWFGCFPVFLITSVLAAGYDFLFVILQRYNRPRVLRLAAREASSSQKRQMET